MMTSITVLLFLTAWIRHWTGPTTASCFQFCSDVCMSITLFTVFRDVILHVHTFLGQLCSFMTAMLPVMTAVQYGAGEITTASVNRISLTLFITVLNHLQRGLFLPLGQALYSVSIASAVCTKIPLGGFTGAVKKLFMVLFSYMILVYSFVYGLQNSLAAGTDSLGLRTVKFAMGNFIPIVGGTVSEAFSAVRTGLGYVKIMAGTGGILILCMLVLPTAIFVWGFDLMLSLTHTAAELLDCGSGVRLLADTRSVLQMLAAVLWLSALFFIFAIILFTRTTGQAV
ncbi:MAG: hypothetical protein IKY52_03410, partial [Clostridia bacterium]|nr:hypothetical protein [Clostridia bacterium]